MQPRLLQTRVKVHRSELIGYTGSAREPVRNIYGGPSRARSETWQMTAYKTTLTKQLW
jgi:hypothetical protein